MIGVHQIIQIHVEGVVPAVVVIPANYPVMLLILNRCINKQRYKIAPSFQVYYEQCRI
ncbi:MAG: hypothetical protein JXB88_13180 [Spirochaetales bacterium]|nr:hypothetical protein [Spirochaetales bacterium]